MTHSNLGNEDTKAIIAELETAGCFAIGIESTNRRGGFVAVNVDMMDWNPVQKLGVLQVRCTSRRKSSHYMNVRKNYYLIGRNENGNAFAHPVDVRATNANVPCALMKIWNCTKSQLLGIIRQGDVALIPAHIPADFHPSVEQIQFVPVDQLMINESHHLTAQYRFLGEDGELYVKGQCDMRHTKEQHPFVGTILTKWYRVAVGNRASSWDFSKASID